MMHFYEKLQCTNKNSNKKSKICKQFCSLNKSIIYLFIADLNKRYELQVKFI